MRINMRIICTGIAASALVASCAPNRPGQAQSAPSSGRKCFTASQVNGFHALDRDTVLVTVGARTTYQLEILGTCPDIDWSNRIGIRARGGSWICEGLDAELLVPGPSGMQRCPVLGVTQLSPEAAKAARQRGN
jgi:hypothetical protein